jgi:drug/metabolite transporter (DMT)-like permease
VAGRGITAVVLCAALLHATWNAVLKPIDDRFEVLGLGLVAVALGCLVAAPFAVPARAAWPFVAASAVLHLSYNAALARSYTVGEFNHVYPIARGTSPLLVAIAAATVAGEHPAGWQVAGVCVVSLGLVGLAGRPRTGDGPAVRLALVTGLLISAYTVVDGLGVRHAGDAVSYAVWLFAAEGVVMAPAARASLRGGAARWRRALVTGGLAATAYGLVIWAQRHGALAEVAALRETSVIAAAAIGAVVFHERLGARRVAMSAVIAAGVALLDAG